MDEYPNPPWAAIEEEDGDGNLLVRITLEDDEDATICVVPWQGDEERTWALARVILASPECHEMITTVGGLLETFQSRMPKNRVLKGIIAGIADLVEFIEEGGNEEEAETEEEDGEVKDDE